MEPRVPRARQVTVAADGRPCPLAIPGAGCRSGRARRLRVIRTAPEGAVAQEEVEDGADPPDKGDDDPHDLLHTAHLGASDDVDDAKDPGDRMQKDRQQNLDQKLHERIACGTRDKKEARGWVPAPPSEHKYGAATKLSSRSSSYLQLSSATQEQPTRSSKYPYGFVGRQTCISHTNQGPLRCNLDTSFEAVSNRKLSRMRVVSGSGREGTLESEGSLAERELSFLVRLAQAAASTQKPDELLELIIGEATSALGTDTGSLYLCTPRGRELLLTATNGLNEKMVGKATMRVGEGITGWVAETRRPAVGPGGSEEPHWKWVPGRGDDPF